LADVIGLANANSVKFEPIANQNFICVTIVQPAFCCQNLLPYHPVRN
jgi:hypothetical protein